MPIDQKLFFDEYREHFGPLTQQQVDGLEFLLSAIDGDQGWTNAAQVAYALATIKHECANTFHPIAEYGKGKGRSYGAPDPETGQTYYGRGFVQLTWKANYQKFSGILGIDLVNEPDRAMEPAVAYSILSTGMRQGLFTGKKLDDYFTVEADGFHNDWVNARRIINGLDKAQTIAGYAETFFSILQDANKPVAE